MRARIAAVADYAAGAALIVAGLVAVISSALNMIAY